MYEYLNLHPKGKIVGDCVKRTLAKATNIEYGEISKELNKIKRSLGADSYSSNEVWKKFISINKYKKLSFPAEKGKPRMNGHRFAESYSDGTYILRMAGHLSVCVDGVIYDTWDCRDKCVYNAWKVEEGGAL